MPRNFFISDITSWLYRTAPGNDVQLAEDQFSLNPDLLRACLAQREELLRDLRYTRCLKEADESADVFSKTWLYTATLINIVGLMTRFEVESQIAAGISALMGGPFPTLTLIAIDLFTVAAIEGLTSYIKKEGSLRCSEGIQEGRSIRLDIDVTPTFR